MKSLARNISALTILFTSGHGTADVIYSGLRDITIPTTYGGTYIDVDGMSVSSSPFVGWDFNPFLGGVYLYNSSAFQPARDGTDGMDTVINFLTGETISATGLNFATGSGGSLDHLGTEFTDGAEGYLGFKLGSNYGWMRVVFTNNSAGAKVLDWAYENSGASGVIQTGNVLQSGSVVTLNSAFGSFTLGSTINGANSVIKNGANSTTLTGTNNYSGTTTVSLGTLVVDSANTGSGTVTVNAPATLGGSGSVAGAINVTGVLAPGSSSIQSFASGALTMTTGSTFAYEATNNSSTGADLMAVTGTLTLTDVILDLTAASLGSNTWSLGDKLTLISYTGAGITGGFTGYADDTIYNFGLNQWLFNYDDDDAGDNFVVDATGTKFVTLTAVPEPRAALLGGLGLLMLLRRRR